MVYGYFTPIRIFTIKIASEAEFKINNTLELFYSENIC